MNRKSEAIRVRIEPLTKRTLVQIARDEGLELSDIARRALNEFVFKKTQPATPNTSPARAPYA